MLTHVFFYLGHVAEANLLIGMYDWVSVIGEVFNIAKGKSMSLFELLDDLSVQVPFSTRVLTFVSERIGEIRHSYADITVLVARN